MANYTIHACHLYGNLLNTYGDIGNLLVLEYYAKKAGISLTHEVISIDDVFDDTNYDFVLFGGGQDFEQTVVSQDIQLKKEPLVRYIENDGPFLAICGGYQLLGHYYIGAKGEQIKGISAIDYYTESQINNRFIGDVEIKNEEYDEIYIGFENHNGVTYLGKNVKPLGKVLKGYGNNGQDQTEGVHYKNTYGSYFHGPILARNTNLAKQILRSILEHKYQEDFSYIIELD
ncbi:type 1 glutamine amidotransferase [Vagococcus xieshaowenii]|uniref:Lipid II isoglutaminyl synthase (glutamine-hydrolyzing) subunit GatD n=1 Tax=Vagococcus xieshaowenii TaxID=2562451 RepID=A0AAJ5JLN9_9ENTE|nr:adenosylcobyric acid synthase [Vagococcus xieshaowenii]QCA28565.1 adenosylcobyric acid synthase [Vagococcus xieshaowenii]TFZ40627.1 adenosylcobyric acid synthase [Vagococcus xieshaowenii]